MPRHFIVYKSIWDAVSTYVLFIVNSGKMNQHDVGLFTLKQIQLPVGAFNTFFYLNQSDLPSKFAHGNSDVVPLQLRFGNDLDKSFFTSLGPFNAQVPRNYVGASATVMQRLGLKEKDDIFVSICSAKSLSVITVRPKSRDDYDIMVCRK